MSIDLLLSVLTGLSLLLWLGLYLSPGQRWRTTERLEATGSNDPSDDFSDITVVIPARNEAEVIGATIRSIMAQGRVHRVIVVDDQSDDGTAEIAREAGGERVTVISGQPLPQGWVGKVWAMEQGTQKVDTPLCLLLDADIEMRPGILKALLLKLQSEEMTAVSLMAHPRLVTLWEKLFMPAFVYFFMLLYPFRLSNNPRSKVAAAAGGCVLLRTEKLRQIGGFEPMKSAIIDDCTLARRIKRSGGNIWLGLTHGVYSQRGNDELSDIWNMVARTAFTQLSYSYGLLLVCIFLLTVAYLAPLMNFFAYVSILNYAGIALIVMMLGSYWPTLRYYRMSPLWLLTLPPVAVLYGAMTVSSALRYARGDRSRWKGRAYQTSSSSTIV